MLVHLTVMPVSLVNASSVAFGGGTVASATVIVTPVVLSDPLPPLPPPLDEQPAASMPKSARPPASVALAARPIDVIAVTQSFCTLVDQGVDDTGTANIFRSTASSQNL